MAGKSELNATAASILGFLHEGPMSGWDLVTRIPQEIGDFWSVTRSQIYRELSALAAAGLVEAGEAGARDRRPYSLTDQGAAAFREWINRPPSDPIIRHPLLLMTLFGHHVSPARRAVFLEEFYQRTLRELQAYEQIRQHVPMKDIPEEARNRMLVLDFGIRNAQAGIDWYEALPDDMTGRQRDGES